MEKRRRNCSLGAISLLFHNIFYLFLDFHVLAGTRFPLLDKRFIRDKRGRDNENQLHLGRLGSVFPCATINELRHVKICQRAYVNGNVHSRMRTYTVGFGLGVGRGEVTVT